VLDLELGHGLLVLVLLVLLVLLMLQCIFTRVR
jgi:hypothetical protein